ncbi:RNA polymerase sigma-70 factor [Sphingobacterium sp. UDSM-2020]|uniref:RNA polymerase sigma-70 factor n=1 Tax=Sphingobacterium sp. UDSM-2020 TaxID=2795738 RepID=UPI0019381C7F|nr:RNA polymerase sigma-70 factor [Sphingobacterium sp. UDSM-2020]QQD15442.1 RNA polymerase sigma-70 factor [Sphingobacterium sp. UDSM-2020]
MKNTPNGDAELLAQLRESEHSALTEIYNKYWIYLYQSSFRILQDYDKTNDVIQEVFVNLWEIRSKLFIKLSLKSYLYAAVKYEVLRQLRKQVINDDILDFIDTLEDNSNEQLMEYKELQQQIDQIIEELPSRCQEVFKLSRLEHLTHKEIAEKLAISTKTVEYHIANALVYLRSQLGKTLSIELFILFLINR